MTIIQYVVVDDWQGLYINGDLKIEGHEISMYQAIHIVAKYCLDTNKVRIEKIYLNQEWVEDNGNLPNKFSEIPQEMFEERRVGYENGSKKEIN